MPLCRQRLDTQSPNMSSSSQHPPHDLTPGGAAQAFVRLTSGPEAAAAPVRAVQFGAERFAEHGRSLAAAQRVDDPRSQPRPFSPRLRSNLKVWAAALAVLSEEGLQADIDPAHAWLLDNARIVQQQLDEVLHDLPHSYFQRLPRLADEPLQGLPRVYGVAWAWAAHADSSLDLALLHHFLTGHHEVEALTLRELWALPSTLRVVLVENLRRLAERAAWRHLARRAAQALFEALPHQDAAAVRQPAAAVAGGLATRPGPHGAGAAPARAPDRPRPGPARAARSPMTRPGPWCADWLAEALPDSGRCPGGRTGRERGRSPEHPQRHRQPAQPRRGRLGRPVRETSIRRCSALGRIDRLSARNTRPRATWPCMPSRP